MRIRIRPLAVCLLLAAGELFWAGRVHAQATTASIRGIVTDPSDAVLAHATVTVSNTSTGLSSTQKTDSKGYFVFPDLHIGGPYTITMDKNGFQRFTSTGIILTCWMVPISMTFY